MSGRQTGTTTRQLQAAPAGSIYIWPNAMISYPRALAEHIGRRDLSFHGPDWLANPRNVLCLRGGAIVIDHATRLGPEGEQAIRHARLREIRVMTVLDV